MTLTHKDEKETMRVKPLPLQVPGIEPQYSVAQTALITGMSEAWVRKMIFEDRIESRKIGRRRFISRTTIQEIMGQRD